MRFLSLRLFLWLYYILFYFLSFVFYFILFSFTFVIYFLIPNPNFYLVDLGQSAFAFVMTIQMLKTQRHVDIVKHTKENIALVRSTMFAVILCWLLVAEAVTLKCTIKKTPQKIKAPQIKASLHKIMLYLLEIPRPKTKIEDPWKFYMVFSWSPLEIPLLF